MSAVLEDAYTCVGDREIILQLDYVVAVKKNEVRGTHTQCGEGCVHGTTAL